MKKYKYVKIRIDLYKEDKHLLFNTSSNKKDDIYLYDNTIEELYKLCAAFNFKDNKLLIGFTKSQQNHLMYDDFINFLVDLERVADAKSNDIKNYYSRLKQAQLSSNSFNNFKKYEKELIKLSAKISERDNLGNNASNIILILNAAKNCFAAELKAEFDKVSKNDTPLSVKENYMKLLKKKYQIVIALEKAKIK